MPSFAQDKCGTVEIQNQHKLNQHRETDDHFESWVRQRKVTRNGRTQSGTYKIPVVVHVVHKGESVGSGTNLSDDQIRSQIKVLNRDFNRTNSDASQTPAEFAGVAGRVDIEFVLAQQDPAGKATTGINRVRGSRNQWSINDEATLKNLSYWAAEDYLNIWVADLSSTLLGYAQFPMSDLAGLEDAEDNRLTDGVVIDYSVVGSSDDGTFNLTSDFSKGRTTTHEVGHFFGLRHIWGDDNGSCSGNGDYVDDTPNQGSQTSGCPSHPQTSCTVHSMFQNYMDYTNDVCMNLFTAQQVERMQTVIENSPRRLSLLTSLGGEDPAPVPNDLGLVSVSNPTTISCQQSVVPAIVVANKGTNAISRASFEVIIGNITSTTTMTFPSALISGATTTVNLDPINLSAGDNVISFRVVATNGVTDGKEADNEIGAAVYVPYTQSLPYTEIFDAIPESWSVSPDVTVTWSNSPASGRTLNNSAASLQFYNVTADTRARTMISPAFSLANEGSPYIAFDVAYALSGPSDDDALAVYVLDECTDDYLTGKLVYSKSAPTLATAAMTSASFVPTALNEWRHEVIDLAAFSGRSGLRLVFAGTNGGGNNMYVDNVTIVQQVTTDLAICSVEGVSPVTCATSTSATIWLSNNGPETVTGFVLRYRNGDGNVISEWRDGLPISSGDTIAVDIASVVLVPGTNELSFEVLQPNGLFDVDSTNNALSRFGVVNTDSDIIPLRQNFEGGIGVWSVVNPAGGPDWQLRSTNYGQFAFFDSDDSTAANTWVVSPALDLSNVSQASMFFDVAFIAGSEADLSQSKDSLKDSLEVLISVDCGVSYRRLMMMPATPSTSELSASWSRQFVDLSGSVGYEAARVAIVYHGNGKQQAFLDNIEFFVSDDAEPLATQLPFTIYGTDPASPEDFYITFNLEQRQQVHYTIVDMTGRNLFRVELDDVLNQTYQISPHLNAGIYVLRVQIGQELFSSRLFMND